MVKHVLHNIVVILAITKAVQVCEITVPCQSNIEGSHASTDCRGVENLFRCEKSKVWKYTRPNETAPKATIKEFTYNPCRNELKLIWCNYYYYVQNMIQQYHIELQREDNFIHQNFNYNVIKNGTSDDIDKVCFSWSIGNVESSYSKYYVYIMSSNLNESDNSLKDTTTFSSVFVDDPCNPTSADDEITSNNIANSTTPATEEDKQTMVTILVGAVAVLVVVTTLIVLIWNRRKGPKSERNPFDRVVVLISTDESADSMYLRAAHDLTQKLKDANAFAVYFNAWEKENITIFGIHGWLRRVIQPNTRIILIGSNTLIETLTVSGHADRGIVDALLQHKHSTVAHLHNSSQSPSLINIRNLKFPEDFLKYNKEVLHNKLHIDDAQEVVKSLAIYAAKISKHPQSNVVETSLFLP